MTSADDLIRVALLLPGTRPETLSEHKCLCGVRAVITMLGSAAPERTGLRVCPRVKHKREGPR